MASVYMAVLTSPPTAGTPDADLVAMLEAAGHTVTTALSTTALPDSGYDVCVVTESGSGSSAANTSIPACLLPVVHMETNWNTTRMASVAATQGVATTQLDIIDTTHPIVSGFSDPVTFYNTAGNRYGVQAANLASGVVNVAEYGSNAGLVAIAAADTGATLTTGTAPNRRVEVGFGIGSSSIVNWNANGDALFVEAVEWAAGSAPAPKQGSATGSWSVSGTANGVAQIPIPTGLTATPVSDTEIALDWADAAGASGYDIERDGVVIVYGHAVSNYNDTGLTANTLYTYRVRTVD